MIFFKDLSVYALFRGSSSGLENINLQFLSLLQQRGNLILWQNHGGISWFTLHNRIHNIPSLLCIPFCPVCTKQTQSGGRQATTKTQQNLSLSELCERWSRNVFIQFVNLDIISILTWFKNLSSPLPLPDPEVHSARPRPGRKEECYFDQERELACTSNILNW